MDCAQVIFTLLLLVPCDNVGGASINVEVAEALASPGRMEKDRQSDPFRRPDLVLGFFEIQPGMVVLDLFSGGGYYTEIVSRVVGDQGEVLAHNNAAYVAYAKDDIDLRYADNRLANVNRITSEADQLELPESRFDAALVMLTWHDFYYLDEENGWPAIDEASLVSKLCAALKPGAVLGLTDHVAAEGSDPQETAQNLHRIDPQRIKADLQGSCFEYEGELQVLRNSADDHSQPMFAEGVRGKTDRVVYKFRRR
jgi:predicted methyltransferase